MANSSTNMIQIAASQANKEAYVNGINDAMSPAALYGRHMVLTAGLTWGYFGGTVMVGGAPAQIENGTVTLAASATNYVEANPTDGTVSVNQAGFTSGRTPLYRVVTGSSTVASYTDLRVPGGGSVSGLVKSVNTKTPDSSGAVTLSASDVGADASGAASAAITAHDAATDPHPQYLTPTKGDARYPLVSSEGQANGIATLDSSGKLPASQLPNLAIIDFLGAVADQASMLALSGQKGDWCTRSDNSKVYVISGSDPTQVSSWTALSYPTGTGGTVTSVDLAVPGLLYTVSGGPITGSGTLTFALKTQAKNTFLAGPASGADATPAMRAITQGDLPAQPFDLTAFYPGVPAASAKVTRVPIARAVSFAANFAGSVGIASVAATSSTAFDVQKNGASIGTITFAAGATTATFTTSGGATVSLAAGDNLSIIAPASPDATLADPGFVLAGTR